LEILVFLALIGLSIWVAVDANKRGNTMAWGFGVFMLLIVFLPLYFINRNPLPSEVRVAPPIPMGIPVLCSNCGKYSSVGTSFCPHCGSKLCG
jgi:hypothetical protein